MNYQSRIRLIVVIGYFVFASLGSCAVKVSGSLFDALLSRTDKIHVIATSINYDRNDNSMSHIDIVITKKSTIEAIRKILINNQIDWYNNNPDPSNNCKLSDLQFGTVVSARFICYRKSKMTGEIVIVGNNQVWLNDRYFQDSHRYNFMEALWKALIRYQWKPFAM